MDEFVIPNGGGAGMKFWAHLDNWAKYGIKAVQTVTGGTEQGNTLRGEYDSLISNTQLRNLTPEEKQYFLTHPNQDSLGLKKGLDTLYRFKRVRPVVEPFNDELYYVGVQEIRDTILKKKILKEAQDLISKENKKNQERAEEIFHKGDY